MDRTRALLLRLASVGIVALPVTAEVFTWVDEEGVTHIVDDPAAVPEAASAPTALRPGGPEMGIRASPSGGARSLYGGCGSGRPPPRLGRRADLSGKWAAAPSRSESAVPVRGT